MGTTVENSDRNRLIEAILDSQAGNDLREREELRRHIKDKTFTELALMLEKGQE